MVEKTKKQYEDDDGRVICSMDVDGMRWHDKDAPRREQAVRNLSPSNQMTRSESWRFTWSAILAGLVIALVFSVTWVLFILFCTEIWFR